MFLSLKRCENGKKNSTAHAIVRVVVHDVTILDIDVEWVAAGLHRGARRSAEPPGVSPLELNPLRQQAVHDWRADLAVSVVAGGPGPWDVRPAQIVLNESEQKVSRMRG